MKTLTLALMLFAVPGLFAAPAWGKGGSPQTHHCKLPDGTMDMAKTKKQCKDAKGQWAPDAVAASPSPSPKPAAK
jgi:hypothetical protein